jgi:hypothetical protein
VVASQRAQEGALARGGDRPGQIERDPAVGGLDVRAAAAVGGAVEVQERDPAHVEHAGGRLDDARPPTDLGEEAREVVE